MKEGFAQSSSPHFGNLSVKIKKFDTNISGDLLELTTDNGSKHSAG